MAKWLRIALVALLVGAGLLMLLLVGVVSYVDTPQAQKGIQKQIDRLLPGSVTWRRATISVLAGRIDIDDLLVAGPSRERLAGWKHLHVDLAWLPMLKGRIVVEEARLDKPWAELAVDENGRLNLMRAFPEPAAPPAEKEDSGGPAVDLTVAEFTLTGGEVSYQDPSAALALTLAGLSATVAGMHLPTPAGRITIGLDTGQVESPAFTGPIDRFQIMAHLDADRLAPLAVRIGAGGTSIDLSGSVERLGADPTLDLTLDAALALDEIRHLLKLSPELTGKATLHATASGPLADPEAGVNLEYGGGRLGGYPVERVSLGIFLADRMVRIDPLQAVSDFGTLEGDGRIDLKRAFPEGFLSSRRELGAVGYQLALRHSGLLMEKLLADASGRLDARLSVDGTGVLPGRISAEVRAAVTGSAIVAPGMSGPVDAAADVRGGIDGEEAAVDALTVTAGGATLTAGGTYHLEDGGITSEAALSAPDLSPLLAIAGIAGARGGVEMTTSVSGTMSRPVARLSASGKGLGLGEIAFGDLGIAAGLDDAGTVDIRTLTLENQGSRAAMSGRIDLLEHRPNQVPVVRSDLPVDLALTLAEVAPGDFVTGAGLQGRVNGTLTAQGPALSPRVRADIAGKGLMVGKNAIGDADLRLGFSGGRLEIERLAVHNRRSDLAVDGTVTLLNEAMAPVDDPAFDITIREGRIFVGDFLEGGTGELTLSGGLAGRRSDPGADLSLTGRDLALGDVRVGGLDARIRMSEGRILLSPVAVENGPSKLVVSGSVGLLSPGSGAVIDDPELDLRVSGDTLRLEDFMAGMAGTLALNGNIGGSIARPQGTMDLSGERLSAYGQSLHGLNLGLRMDGRTVRIDPLRAAVTPAETVEGRGAIDLDGSAYDLTLHSTGISLAGIEALGGSDVVGGTIALDLAGKGTFDDPRAEGWVSMKGLRVNGAPVEDFRVNLAVRDRSARVWGRPGFDLDGRYHLDSKSFSATLGFDRTALAPYFGIAGLKDLGGAIDGTLTARGRADAPGDVNVTADLRNLSLVSKDRTLLTAPRIQARLENGAYTIKETQIRLLSDGRISMAGQGRVDGDMAFTVEGRIPLAVVGPFMEDDGDIQGLVLLDARIGGRVDAPDLRGSITLERLGMTLPGLAQRLHDVTGRIALSPEALTLEKIEGRIDDGRFSVDGRMALEGFTPARMDIKATARMLPIEVPDTLSLLLDSRLALTGTMEDALLKGQIILLEGSYTKDVELNLVRGVTEKKRAVEPEPASKDPSFLNRMALDIVVKRREPFVVDNNLAEMSVSPDLRVLGTAERPVVSGRAVVDEGVITYQRREFEIRKGVVDFLNPYKTEPSVDIEAEASVREWVVSLAVSGTPDNLDFRLSSNPPEEHADILSLLAFGKTLSEMRQGDGGSLLSPRQLMGDILTDSVTSGVKSATGLDIVDLEFTEADAPDASDDVKVTLGKELSRRITVKYGAEIKQGETVQKVTSEYKILEDLIVSAFQDTAGNFGGSLIFRMEFR